MANFGSYFLRNFSPNFANTFNTSYRHGLDQQEEERKRQELLKQQQKQQGVLSQLIGGNKIDASYRGMYSPLDVTQTPLNSNEKFWLYSQLDPANQNAYEYWQKENAPKEVKYKEWNGNQYQVNSDGSIDWNKPVAVKPEEVKPVWIKDEPFGDKWKKLMGVKNPNADPKDPRTKVVNGEKWTVTDYTTQDFFEKKTNQEGKDIYGLTPDTKKALNDYYKEQQRLFAITQAGFGENKITPDSEETFAEKLNKHNATFNAFVDNMMRPSARKWYRDLYNKTDENKKVGNPDPEDYWNELKRAYKEGKLGNDPNAVDNYEDADFETLLAKFKATYGFDPAQIYGK